MDGIFHTAGTVGMDYGYARSAINKTWPARIKSLTVTGNNLAALHSAFSTDIQALCSYLLLVSLCEYV